jgi:raffinose/stachyose/melibiose transport system substrate-binding protein
MSHEELPMIFYPGFAAMQMEGNWMDRNILRDEQDLSLYGTFPFPNGGTNRMSSTLELYQFNDNLTDAELNAAVKLLNYFFEQHNVDASPSMFGLPIPQIGREDSVPPERVNIPDIMSAAAANGTFSISDQALPPVVVTELFNVLDYLALGTMTPEEAASAMQRAIERFEQER